jgi:2-polyprenyl-3-methyl-5-hydroxy-6-metoxy-1,4-benzoquinol methylase
LTNDASNAASRECPACGVQSRLTWFENTIDNDGHLTTIDICTSCTVLHNGQLDTGGGAQACHELQATTVANVYANLGLDVEQARQKRDACIPILRFVLDQPRLVDRRRTFLEIGAGGGYLTAAGSLSFTRAYALELDLSQVRRTVALLGLENVVPVTGLDEVADEVDLVVMWHVLEHVAQPLPFLRSVKQKMSEGGVLFFQVPLYRKAYLFPSHLWFFNACSVTKLREALGFERQQVVFDTGNDFMSVVFE